MAEPPEELGNAVIAAAVGVADAAEDEGKPVVSEMDAGGVQAPESPGYGVEDIGGE